MDKIDNFRNYNKRADIASILAVVLLVAITWAKDAWLEVGFLISAYTSVAITGFVLAVCAWAFRARRSSAVKWTLLLAAVASVLIPMNSFFKPFSRRIDPYDLFIKSVEQSGNLEKVVYWSRERLAHNTNSRETKDTQIPDQELPFEVRGLCPREEFRGPSVYLIRASWSGETFIAINYDFGRDSRCGLFIGSTSFAVPSGEVTHIRVVTDGVFEFWDDAKY